MGLIGSEPTDLTRDSESATDGYQQAVAAYVAAGGDESVQRVITALYGVTRKLDRWYNRQLADLGVSHGEWAVLAHLAMAGDSPTTPSELAEIANVAASSMTHRLDRMSERGVVTRTPDPSNRTRVLITLTGQGWELFSAAVREANVVEADTLATLSKAQRGALADLLEVVISGLDDLDTS